MKWGWISKIYTGFISDWMLIFPDFRREKSLTEAMKSVYMANSPENESLNYHSIRICQNCWLFKFLSRIKAGLSLSKDIFRWVMRILAQFCAVWFLSHLNETVDINFHLINIFMHLLSIYGTVFDICFKFGCQETGHEVQENVKTLRIWASSLTIDVTTERYEDVMKRSKSL